MKKIFTLFLSLLCFFSSCSRSCYNYATTGACDFVIDSYKIRQGKFSILELEGLEVEPIPCCYLEEYQDQIDEDDILKIAVYHPSRKDISEAVSVIGETVGYRVVQGQIVLPELPPVQVIGLTLEEARIAIQDLYDCNIEDTEVFIEYNQRLHSKVDLIGNVSVPEVPVNGRIRLYEVLAIAQVPPSANLFKSYVVRDCQMLPIDLYQLMCEGDMSQNIVMQANDKIFIADPAAANVMVMGEVGIPSVIPVPSGTISLREAIVAAGGIPYTGDKRCIQVIRGNIVNPKIYSLSWDHIIHLPNDSLLLMPGDTVYIAEKPITAWNRFIDQLLPSSLLIDLGIKTRNIFND